MLWICELTVQTHHLRTLHLSFTKSLQNLLATIHLEIRFWLQEGSTSFCQANRLACEVAALFAQVNQVCLTLFKLIVKSWSYLSNFSIHSAEHMLISAD